MEHGVGGGGVGVRGHGVPAFGAVMELGKIDLIEAHHTEPPSF